MNKIFTKKNISVLNNYIKTYYGNEINIYMFHGIFVGYFSSANEEIKPTDIIASENPILEIVYPGYIEEEFPKLLFNGLYKETLADTENHNNIIPMIDLDKLRGPYFSYNKLNAEEKRNLLDWYLGYFMSIGSYLNNEVIDIFLDAQNSDEEPLSFGGVTAEEIFEDGMSAQEITFCDLLRELKPKYKHPDIVSLIKNIKNIVAEYDEDEIAHYRQIAQRNGCTLLCSVLVVAQAAVSYKNDLNNIKDGSVKVH